MFGDINLEVKIVNISIRSFKHKLKTIKSDKFTYNSFDNKKGLPILEDKIHNLANRHYSLE